MNYTELTAAIQQYCECYEAKFIANIPTFVKMAEQRIYNAVQLPVTRKTQALSVSVDSPAIRLVPSDFLSPFSLGVVAPLNVDIQYLLQKDYEWLQEAYPNDTYEGPSLYYALCPPTSDAPMQPAIRVAPMPDPQYGAYAYVLNYYAKQPSIVTAGNTWLGDNFDSALLFAAVMEGYVFLKGQQDMLTIYEQKYEQQLALLKQLGDGKDRQDTYRVQQVRVGVQ